MRKEDFGLTKEELKILKKLSTPIKIQDWLDAVPLNHEKNGETYMSPRRSLRENKMHCLEGALVAALALWLAGEEPLLLDLKAPQDIDHVVALYQRNGYWGAISKTNHAALRFRDPVYKTIRELALSYFNEYFDNETRKKTLRSYAGPYNLKKLEKDWITTEEDLFSLPIILDDLPHKEVFPKINIKYLRLADKMELKAGGFVEWEKNDRRT
jgi:hypothetical protein